MSAVSPIAILSALAQEQAGLLDHLMGAKRQQYAGREFWSGQLHGCPVVLALSRIGKVAASTTACALIERFGARGVVFTGVAGGVGDGVRVGDVVVGTSYIQHDMDASPLFPRYEVPLTGKSLFPGEADLTAQVLTATRLALLDGGPDGQAQVHSGLIASGDRFVNGAQEVRQLVDSLRVAGYNPLAVEMEGAAVAQVCSDHGVAFAAVRTISDRADDTAHVDFTQFVTDVASLYAQRIITALLQK